MKKSQAKSPFNQLPKKLLKGFVAASIFIAGYFSYPFLVDSISDFSYKERTISGAQLDTNPEYLKVCFTPNQSCLPSILKSIDGAKSNILLLGYSFTSQPIANALISAKKRGIKVRIVLDHSQLFQKASKESINTMIKEQIEVRFDHSVKIAHNKVLIIDGVQTITGSYNWSNSADNKNAENLVFIGSKSVSRQYTDYFESRWNIATPRSVNSTIPSSSSKIAHKRNAKTNPKNKFKVIKLSKIAN